MYSSGIIFSTLVLCAFAAPQFQPQFGQQMPVSKNAEKMLKKCLILFQKIEILEMFVENLSRK